MITVPVTRSEARLLPDPSRRITRTYFPNEPGSTAGSPTRMQSLIERVLSLSPEEADRTLSRVRTEFARRVDDLDEVLARGFSAVSALLPETQPVSESHRRLLGAYFMHEYSIEGSALTNPSMVIAPDQTGMSPGHLQVILALRAIGEGHISSIEFRTGEIGPYGQIEIDPPDPPVTGNRGSPLYRKSVFVTKLSDMGADPGLVSETLGHLDDRFTMEGLEAALLFLDQPNGHPEAVERVRAGIHWLVSSNYVVEFPPETRISQRVLTPSGPAERGGMEDARFVRLTEPDGSVVYHATYTAYDGFNILPQLIETTDFARFHVTTLGGRFALNKGMALFPRRIGGRYAALSRFDGESNYLMLSDDVHRWDDAQRIQMPRRPWELLQIGNAGSPLETDRGWLVITHGVGPLRSYALGAILLDLDDPTRVIGHLPEPLLAPDDSERDGYVPNVVYSCGSVLHQGRVVIAYGAADTGTRFASVMVDDLLDALTGGAEMPSASLADETT
jgi:predicted GH43/DUF377 family glycosyl hydrolase